jgi:hypothetical protein
VALRQVVEDFQNGIECSQDVRLGPPEGRKTQSCQFELQRAKIVATQSQVMQEVSGTVAIVAVNGIEEGLRHGSIRNHIRSEGRELSVKDIDFRRVQASTGIVRGQRRIPLGTNEKHE